LLALRHTLIASFSSALQLERRPFFVLTFLPQTAGFAMKRKIPKF